VNLKPPPGRGEKGTIALAGYRLSSAAATAHNLQSLIEEAQGSTN
jgi:hypothetical protein